MIDRNNALRRFASRILPAELGRGFAAEVRRRLIQMKDERAARGSSKKPVLSDPDAIAFLEANKYRVLSAKQIHRIICGN